jgi:hypothetical protein
VCRAVLLVAGSVFDTRQGQGVVERDCVGLCLCVCVCVVCVCARTC